MNGNPPSCIHALLGALTAIVTLVWLILLIASILFRPRPEPGTRVIERMLIVTSALMILCFGALYLALQSRGSG